ncbi:hypothetical protein D3C79_1065290 [compost metagenome]
MADHSRPCRTDELAQFGLEEAGETFCTGFAMQLTELAKKTNKELSQMYFCLPPDAAEKVASE